MPVVWRYRPLSRFSPAAAAVVEEESGARGDAVDQQVQVGIAIHIDQHRAGGHLANTGGLADRHGLEAPLAQVAVELVGAVQTAEVEVWPTIAVHVADGHARTIVGHRVGEVGIADQDIGEGHPGCGRIHQREPGPLAGDRRQGRGSHLEINRRQGRSARHRKETHNPHEEDPMGCPQGSAKIDGHGG